MSSFVGCKNAIKSMTKGNLTLFLTAAILALDAFAADVVWKGGGETEAWMEIASDGEK